MPSNFSKSKIRRDAHGVRVLKESQDEADKDNQTKNPLDATGIVDAINFQGGWVNLVMDGALVYAIFYQH